MKFVMPIILIGIGLATFFVFTNPLYNDITLLRTTMASYNEALNNSKALENERDKLTAKYNSIDPDNLAKIRKLLPENIDNIRLILEIEQIAAPYGMVLKDVKYSTTSDKENGKNVPLPTGAVQGGSVVSSPRKDYGVWDLEFSTAGTYNNFLNFTRDLESNLRMVDISSIQFSSNVSGGGGAFLPEIYKYTFSIKTYWLKN